MALHDNVSDPHNLQRFLDAQESTYEEAHAELQAGRKRTHWMWFIFPQIRGLGSSPMAQRFALAGLAEAAAYLEHPVLGARLRACTRCVCVATQPSVAQIFGYPDDLKFHSSMTLFARAAKGFGAENQVFADALNRYFGGTLDEGTVARLGDPT